MARRRGRTAAVAMAMAMGPGALGGQAGRMPQSVPTHSYRVNDIVIDVERAATGYPQLYPFQQDTRAWYQPPEIPEASIGPLTRTVTDARDPYFVEHGGFARSLHGCDPTAHPPNYRCWLSCPGFSGLSFALGIPGAIGSIHCGSGKDNNGDPLWVIPTQIREGVAVDGAVAECAPTCCRDTAGSFHWSGNENAKSLWDLRFRRGGCSTKYWPEELYCFFYGFTSYYPWRCNDTFTSGSTRSMVNPCFDYFTWWLSTQCVYYKLHGFRETWEQQRYEPKAYYDRLTPEQINAVFATFFSPDRVCHPLTYYFPEEKQSKVFNPNSGGRCSYLGVLSLLLLHLR